MLFILNKGVGILSQLGCPYRKSMFVTFALSNNRNPNVYFVDHGRNLNVCKVLVAIKSQESVGGNNQSTFSDSLSRLLPVPQKKNS